MGDPTLRVFVCPPPSDLVATVEDDAVTFTWSASSGDDVLGYHLYRKIDGAYQRVNQDLIQGLTYTESDLDAGTHEYMPARSSDAPPAPAPSATPVRAFLSKPSSPILLIH